MNGVLGAMNPARSLAHTATLVANVPSDTPIPMNDLL